MSSFLHDLRHGLRGLLKQPAFTALAVLTLALGIGASSTIFSVIYGVLLDPFPYVVDKDRVVLPEIVDSANPNNVRSGYLQLPEFLDYQEQTRSYESIIAGTQEDVLWTTDAGTERLYGASVSGNTFTFLGVPAHLGRALTEEDSRPGAPPVFVIGHKLWTSRFNLDPSILGRTYVLDGVPTTLVGIMPPRFTKMGVDLYRAVSLDRSDARLNQRYFRFQGKLKPGVTLDQAAAEFALITQRLAQTYPRNYPAKYTTRVTLWVDWIVGRFQRTLYTLAAAVGLLLLIACGNVANMLLAWGMAREKEMAIRAALGAGRARLVRQLLSESLLLALAGCVVGTGFAFLGIKILLRVLPQNGVPAETVIQLNLPVLLFCLALSVLTSLLFGLVPALQTARRDLVEPLKDARKGGGSSSRSGRLRSALVVAEVALSIVLLTGAGLLMRDFAQQQNTSLGFDPEHTLAARLSFARGQYTAPEARLKLFREILPRLNALPGVVSAAVASSLPPFGGRTLEIDIPGATHADRWEATATLCSASLFQTLNLPLVRGRLFTEAEVEGARRLAVVNRTFVNRYLGDADPVGRQLVFKNVPTGPGGKTEDTALEIVGVVPDVKNQGADQPVLPEAWVPLSLTGGFRPGILVRTHGEPQALVQSVQREIWAVDRSVAVTNIDSIASLLRQFVYAGPRFAMMVLAAFAAVGLVLVAIGVFSVMAYTVTGQTHEIGIRMALGASRGDVLGMILKKGLILVGLGVVVGLAAAFALRKAIASQLSNLDALDPLTLGAVVAVMLLAGLAACWFPARRATKVDPIIALRAE